MRERAPSEPSHEDDHVSRLLVDSLQDHAIYMLDRQGVVIRWSVGAERVQGFAADDIVGRDFGVLFAPEDQAANLPGKALEAADRDGRFEFEAWQLKKSGDRFYANAIANPVRDEAGELVGFALAARDITERHLAAIELRASEIRYRTLAESGSDVMLLVDPDLTTCHVSPAARAVLGYAPAELLLRPFTDVVHPDAAEQVRAVFQRAFLGELDNDKAVTTIQVRHKEGHFIWGEVAISLVLDQPSASKLIICSLRDVTARHLIAEQLIEAKITAEHASRQKAEFLANMSHELRTPLTAILGLHDLLHSDPTLSAKQERYLTMASNAGRSLLGIVNDVLDLSKIEAGEIAIQSVSFDLAQFAETCHHLALPQADAKSIYCRVHLSGDPVVLVGDAARLQQIVLNMLTNAVKFTETGGVDLRLSYRKDTSKLRIEVSDTGIGIAEDKVPLLFERFTQADESITRRYGGTGLGLAICKRLTELMGGEIGLRSKVGSGTTVWLEIHLEQAVSAEKSKTGQTNISSSAKYHVLLAEDNELNQEIISAILEQLGHTVTRVGDGVAAMNAVQSGDPFDVVLMDLQMPVMDGLSATRAIRVGEVANRRVPTPIIGLTANAMVEDVERCRSAGMQAHVAKPIEWGQLISAIDKVASKAPTLAPDLAARRGRRIPIVNEPSFAHQSLA